MSHNTRIYNILETIWIEWLYIPIYFGRFDSEISDLKKIHTTVNRAL